MKFVPSDLRAGENVFHWQEDPSKIQQGRKSGKWLTVDIVVMKEGPMQLFSTGSTIFRTNISNLSNLSDTLWIWKNFQIRVKEQEHLFCGSSANDKQMLVKCFQTILI